MYSDFYLRFSDKAQANAILYTEVPTKWDDEGNVLETEPRPNYANIDVLGILYEKQDIPDPENPPPPIPLPGWHVNVRVLANEDPTPLEPFAVVPTHPRRIWG